MCLSQLQCSYRHNTPVCVYVSQLPIKRKQLLVKPMHRKTLKALIHAYNRKVSCKIPCMTWFSVAYRYRHALHVPCSLLNPDTVIITQGFVQSDTVQWLHRVSEIHPQGDIRENRGSIRAAVYVWIAFFTLFHHRAENPFANKKSVLVENIYLPVCAQAQRVNKNK